MSSHEPSRFARHVVIAKGAVALVEHAASNATSSSSGTNATASAAAAAAKKAIMADQTTWNEVAMQNLNIALGFAVALFFLACAPSAAAWFASGRYNTGWRLRRGNSTATGSSNDKEGKRVFNDEKNGKAEPFSTVDMVEKPLLLKATPNSALFASTRTVYNRTLLATSPLFGLTWGQISVCILYELLFAFCLFYRCIDHRSNWRRSAGVATAQLPAVFVLATKNNALSLLGKGYEKLNYLHRVAGRLTILGGLLHTLFYLLNAPLDVKNAVHLSGLVCTVASCFILVTSVSYFRNRFYQVFLASHIAGWITLIVALNFHVPDLARPYTVFVLTIYGVDLLCRLAKTRFGSASIAKLPGGTVMVQSHSLSSGWRTGQHVWLRVSSAAGLHRGWETHPFTIANAPAECSPLDGSHALTVLAKTTGGWTRGLEAHASLTDSPHVARTIKCAIEGPYGGLMYSDMVDTSAVVLVAGGSGITFCASVLEELVQLAALGRTSSRTATLVWTVKDVTQLESYQTFLTELVKVAGDRTYLNLRVLLHVTRPPPGSPLQGTLPSPIPQTVLSIGRPSLSSILGHVTDEVLDSVQRRGSPRGSGILLGACGPKGLVTDVRAVAGGVDEGKAVAVGGIMVHTETFGW